MADKWNAPGAEHSARGRECLPDEVGSLDITENRRARQSAHRWRVSPETDVPFTIEAPGRLGWALTVLREAGDHGVTTAELPAGLRWSAYVHKLRRLGVPIWTSRESNGGPWGGHHARYILAARVEQEGGA